MNLSTPSASPASARTYQPPDAEGSFGGSFRPSEPAPATAPPPNVGPRPLKADREDSFCCPTCSHVHMGYRPTLQTALPAHSRAIALSIPPLGLHKPRSSCARAAPSHSYSRGVPAVFPVCSGCAVRHLDGDLPSTGLGLGARRPSQASWGVVPAGVCIPVGMVVPPAVHPLRDACCGLQPLSTWAVHLLQLRHCARALFRCIAAPSAAGPPYTA